MGASPGGIGLSELIAGLSCALDMAEGEPPGHAQRSCLIGMRLASVLGLAADARSDLFYALLLKDAGCTANAAHMAALFGADDQVAKRTSKFVDWSRPLAAFVWSVRSVAPGRSLRAKTERLWAIRNEGAVTRSLMAARCHQGAEIARKLGFSEATADAIRGLDEHWDGHGQPQGLSGVEIPHAARILCLAQTVEVFHYVSGVDAACQVALRRSGRWFDPELVEALVSFRGDSDFWESLTEPEVSAVEPADRVLIADQDRLDRITHAFGDVVGAKSTWTREHCDRVSAIATRLAAQLGVDARTRRDLGRAARLHDIGKLSISNRILDKPGPLSDADWRKIRMHPLLGEHILERVPSLGVLAPIAGAHHERLDGSGYPRGLDADELTMPMRILAVADVYAALTVARPYRPAYAPHRALELMRTEVPQRLDRDAFAALNTVVRDPAAASAETPWGAGAQARTTGRQGESVKWS
jgi:HD-GYP domain-containing protein (c-di-GMP phosphodiesterase class II)